MATVTETLAKLERDWAEPRTTGRGGERLPFPLACSIVATPAEVPPTLDVPPDLAELWHHASSARLFEDTEFGQAGLVLLSPKDALERTRSRLIDDRPADYTPGDLVIGEFLGDLDMIVMRTDPQQPDFGRVLVALPIDPRSDWYDVADGLSEFLERLAAAEGEKFWEINLRTKPQGPVA